MSKTYYFTAGDDALKGPYSSMEAVRKEVLEQAKDCFDGACNCLKSSDSPDWFEHVRIFEHVATVRPVVKAKFKLEDVHEHKTL